MACLPRPVMMRIWSQPEAMASSTPYWMMGLSTTESISLGWALVAGRKRVPRPAAGRTALRTLRARAGFAEEFKASMGIVRKRERRDELLHSFCTVAVRERICQCAESAKFRGVCVVGNGGRRGVLAWGKSTRGKRGADGEHKNSGD